MVLNTFWFQFPGLERVYCLFQGRGTAGEKNSGNISLVTGADPEEARKTRNALRKYCVERGMASWRELRQVHGDKVVEARELEEMPEADGIMTAAAGTGLLIKTADCQPLLFAHRSGRYIMAIHVGWRGNRMGFPQSATRVFCEKYRLLPRDVFVVRGPSLGPSSAEFLNFSSEWGEDFRPWFNEATQCMDLWRLTRSQLEGAGIPSGNIYGMDLCTAANHDKFFSWRRDKTQGRQASLIWICQR